MNILTTEEFWKTISPDEKYGMLAQLKKLGLHKHVFEVMRRFAKLHVESALIEASEIADYGIYQNDDGQEPFHHESNIFVNKDVILKSYNLENIK